MKVFKLIISDKEVSAMLRSFVLSASLFLILTIPAAAQNIAPGAADNGSIVSAELPPDVEATRPVTDKYLPSTMETLSQLYWALGKLDINNDAAIDGFLLINECKLFNQYSGNDFEWANIRSAERKFISQKMALFPTYLELLVPIKFDRYDAERGAFTLKPESVLMSSRRFELPPNMGSYICGSQNEIPYYPRNVVVGLSRPFTLLAVPVAPELADLYINDIQLRAAERGDPASTASRDAVLRMKIHVTQFIKTFPGHNSFITAELYGRLDGIEVYTDTTKLKLLYSKNFSNKLHETEALDASSLNQKSPQVTDEEAVGITPPAKTENDDDNTEEAPP